MRNFLFPTYHSIAGVPHNPVNAVTHSILMATCILISTIRTTVTHTVYAMFPCATFCTNKVKQLRITVLITKLDLSKLIVKTFKKIVIKTLGMLNVTSSTSVIDRMSPLNISMLHSIVNASQISVSI